MTRHLDGPPWNTTVQTEWTDHITAHDGTTFTTCGSHDAHMRWGRITKLIYHWDQAVVQHAYEHDARLGLTDGTANPIND